MMTMKYRNAYQFMTAVIAGIFIGIAGFAYLKTGGIIGSILFAFGLASIVHHKFRLFTGTAGFITTLKDLGWLVLILLGNLIGTFAVGMLFRYSNPDLINSVDLIVQTKLNIFNKNYLTLFCLSIGCGFIMTTAVDASKNFKNYIPLLLGVPVFILCGFPHCIADSFYIFASNVLWTCPISILLMYGVIIAGNFVGCNLIRVLTCSDFYYYE